MKQKNGGGKALTRIRVSNILLMAACYVVLTAGMIVASSPEQFSLSVGDIAPTTITATKDVVDEVATEQRRERAAEAVQPSYKEDETALERVMDHFDLIFLDFEAVRAYGEGLRSGTIASKSGGGFVYTDSFNREDVEYAASLCTAIELNSWQLEFLMKQRAWDVNSVYVNTSNIIKTQMESTIREGQLEAAISNILNKLLQTMSSDLCHNVAMPAVRACLVPNMIVDQEETEARREAARNEVEPSYYKSGQNIVVAGERITGAELAVLESLGLLEGNEVDMMMLAGVSLLGLLAVLALLFHILQFDVKAVSRVRNGLILTVILVLTMALSALTAQINPYLAPVSMVALLTAALLTPSLAVISNMLALIIVGVLTSNTSSMFTQQMLGVMVAGLLSAPVGIYIVRRKQQRLSILLAGLSMAMANLFAMLAIGLLTNNEMSTVTSNAVWSAGGGVLAAILCTGVQPLLEWMFSIVTPYKLLELANPNQPLLRRLLVETPGTYHHAILVANLSEAAAEAIGADPLLARVGAYYHDIGKLKRPLYFKENQGSDNPHDRTDPRVSTAIIAAHVTDGIQMAREARLPEEVIDFIAQHHGDTTIAFFYHKMLGMEGGENANIEDFRYPGPKPQTAETAIVMLADTAEAAVRAGGNQTPEEIENRIRELIKDKIDSGQLNESRLQFADVSKIIRAFAQVLTGIYHKRVEYPKIAGVNALPAPREAPRMKIAEPIAEPIQEERDSASGKDD